MTKAGKRLREIREDHRIKRIIKDSLSHTGGT